MTFKPISITDRNVVLCSEPCQSGFIDALNDHQLSWLLWKYVCIKMMLGSLICASKFKSVCNRPSTVHYWEHCLTHRLHFTITHRLHSLLHLTHTDCTPSCTLHTQTTLPPAPYTHRLHSFLHLRHTDCTPSCTLHTQTALPPALYTQTALPPAPYTQTALPPALYTDCTPSCTLQTQTALPPALYTQTALPPALYTQTALPPAHYANRLHSLLHLTDCTPSCILHTYHSHVHFKSRWWFLHTNCAHTQVMTYYRTKAANWP